MKTFIQTAKVLILSLVVITAVSYAQAEWSDPTAQPTAGNAETPINVSDSLQDKTGGFSAAALVGDNITAAIKVTSPKFCIGSDCIEEWPGGVGDIANQTSSGTWTAWSGNLEYETENGEYICGVNHRRNCDFYSSDDSCMRLKICSF